MIIFKEAKALQHYIENQKSKGQSIGFVPTMGALHNGHISLISASKKETDITVCSIFINPTQFNDPTDFEKYPVTIKEDIALLESHQCAILFIPPVSEIYPHGTDNGGNYDLGKLEFVLEGEYRPGHFQGVCQVVERLLRLANPDVLFLGQKDFQQQLIIKNLIKIIGLLIKVETVITLREPSGLAMSSRNMRLNDEQKKQASVIYSTLEIIKQNFRFKSFPLLESAAEKHLLKNGFEKVDYVKIVSASDLSSVNRWDGTGHLVALIAASIGGVRLIDNMIITGNDVGTRTLNEM